MTDPSNHGRVIARFNKNFVIETGQGELLAAVARKKLGDIVCGDAILWERADNNSAVIIAVTERRSLLERPDRRGRIRPIAANISQIIIVNSVLPQTDTDQPASLNYPLLDRYLIAAETLAIPSLILINKLDQLNPDIIGQLEPACDYYRRLDYPVLMTSCKNGTGMDELMLQLRNQTSIFVGESGVGKSSLIHYLLPDQEIRIGEISALSGRGRHTTTTTTLYPLPQGGNLIDSPGVREFGLWHIDADSLSRGFREFHPLLGRCRFRNCRHLGEPGCAIEQACQHNDIARRRLDSYRSLMAALKPDGGQ